MLADGRRNFEMKFLVAVVFLLLSLVVLFFAVDASGSLQDAPPRAEQTRWTLPYTVAFLTFGAASVTLFVKAARRGV